MTKYQQLATDIRRGILLIASAIRRHLGDDPRGSAAGLAEVLEAAADGIKEKFDIGGSEGRR